MSFQQCIKASFPYFLLALIFIGCKKEEVIYPGINLERQGLSALYDYRDTMRLNFSATNTDSYQISLLQGTEVFQVEQRLLYKEGNNYEVELYFTDPYFPTGTYDLRIQVFNGEEGVSTFYPFTYRELPLSYEDYVLLGKDKVCFVEFYTLNRTDFPLNKSYDQIMVSSRDSLVYLAAFADENLAVHDLKDMSLIGDFPLPAPSGSKSYHDFIKTDRGLFALQTDGDIKYFQGGTVESATSVDNGLGEQARRGAWLGSNLALVVAEAGGANPELQIMNPNLNGVRNTYPLNDPNAYLVKLSGTKVGVFERINSQLEFATYDLQTGVFNLEFIATIGAVKEAAYARTSPDNDLLLFATADKFYSYQLGSFGAPSLDQTIVVKNFRLQRLDDILSLQNGNQVQTYVSPGNLSFASTFFGELQDFDILYNK